MEFINDIKTLEALYGTPGAASTRKVVHRLTPLYRQWIMTSRYCVLSTVGPDGTDGSPRGDDGPVVMDLDERTLAMPDWRGNNRLDSLRNIVSDGRVSLMFMVPGSNTVVRVNGTAKLTADEGLRARFEQKGKHPATVIVIAISNLQPGAPGPRSGPGCGAGTTVTACRRWASCCLKPRMGTRAARSMTPTGAPGRRRRCGSWRRDG